MASVKVEIDGMDKLQKKLTALSDDFWRSSGANDVQSVMRRSLYRLVFELANYPPQPTGSTYRRTGTLGRRWTERIKVKSSARECEGSIGNNTEYAPLVQSSKYQARVHRGRWITDARAIERQRKNIEDDFSRALRAKIELTSG